MASPLIPRGKPKPKGPPLLDGAPVPVSDLFHCNFVALQQALVDLVTAINDLQAQHDVLDKRLSQVESGVSVVPGLQQRISGVADQGESVTAELARQLDDCRAAHAELASKLASDIHPLQRQLTKVEEEVSGSFEQLVGLERSVTSSIAELSETVQSQQNEWGGGRRSSRSNTMARWKDGVAAEAREAELAAQERERLFKEQLSRQSDVQIRLTQQLRETKEIAAANRKALVPLVETHERVEEQISCFTVQNERVLRCLEDHETALARFKADSEQLTSRVELMWGDLGERRFVRVTVDTPTALELSLLMDGGAVLLRSLCELDDVAADQVSLLQQSRRSEIKEGKARLPSDFREAGTLVPGGSMLLCTELHTPSDVRFDDSGIHARFNLTFLAPHEESDAGVRVREAEGRLESAEAKMTAFVGRLAEFEVGKHELEGQLSENWSRLEAVWDELLVKADMSSVDQSSFAMRCMNDQLGAFVQKLERTDQVVQLLNEGQRAQVYELLGYVKDVATSLFGRIDNRLGQASAGFRCLSCRSWSRDNNWNSEVSTGVDGVQYSRTLVGAARPDPSTQSCGGGTDYGFVSTDDDAFSGGDTIASDTRGWSSNSQTLAGVSVPPTAPPSRPSSGRRARPQSARVTGRSQESQSAVLSVTGSAAGSGAAAARPATKGRKRPTSAKARMTAVPAPG